MDAPLTQTFVLDLDLCCRGSGIPKFSGVSEIGDLRQARAVNPDKNWILQLFVDLFLCLHNGFLSNN